jgi:hypothetical protein
MSLRIISGGTSSAGGRGIKLAKISLNPAKWLNNKVSENVDTPSTIASPPFLKILSRAIKEDVSDSSESDSVVNQDRNEIHTTTTLTKNSFELSIKKRLPLTEFISWSSSNEAVATVGPTGNLEVLSDGNVIITATANPSGISNSISLSVSISDGEVLISFDSFVSGSLAYHCEDSINSKIQNATIEQLPTFSVQNHSSQIYQRNSNCWINSLAQQITCVSPWNSTGLNTRAGTLITPRHILFAAHYEISEGATVRFVTADNQVINRTMVRRRRHPSYVAPPYYPDLTVGVLDSDVPTSITPCKILPANYEDRLPTGPLYIATLCFDQEKKALVTDLGTFSSSMVSFVIPNLSYEKILYEDKIIGDSGSPAFLIINNELALLTVWTFGGEGSGTFVTPQISSINQMIIDVDALAGNGGTGYTLQTVDLSGFTNFA